MLPALPVAVPPVDPAVPVDWLLPDVPVPEVVPVLPDFVLVVEGALPDDISVPELMPPVAPAVPADLSVPVVWVPGDLVLPDDICVPEVPELMPGIAPAMPEYAGLAAIVPALGVDRPVVGVP